MVMAGKSKIAAIETKIKTKQDKLFKLKEQSDKIATEIEELLKEKEALRKQEILEAIESSGRTYEEITEFLRSAPKRNNVAQKPKRKYTKRAK